MALCRGRPGGARQVPRRAGGCAAAGGSDMATLLPAACRRNGEEGRRGQERRRQVPLVPTLPGPEGQGTRQGLAAGAACASRGPCGAGTSLGGRGDVVATGRSFHRHQLLSLARLRGRSGRQGAGFPPHCTQRRSGAGKEAARFCSKHAAAVVPAPNTVQLESGAALHCRLRALLLQKAVYRELEPGLSRAGSGQRNEGVGMERV